MIFEGIIFWDHRAKRSCIESEKDWAKYGTLGYTTGKSRKCRDGIIDKYWIWEQDIPPDISPLPFPPVINCIGCLKLKILPNCVVYLLSLLANIAVNNKSKHIFPYFFLISFFLIFQIFQVTFRKLCCGNFPSFWKLSWKLPETA